MFVTNENDQFLVFEEISFLKNEDNSCNSIAREDVYTCVSTSTGRCRHSAASET